MKRVSLILLPALLVVILAGLFLRPTFAHGAAASSTGCGKGWTIVPSPNKDGYHGGGLKSVTAISANDAWAVGYSVGEGNSEPILIEHWNGTAWSIVPYTGSANSYLNGVAAVATNDVWAVAGAKENGKNVTLIIHWNGIKWSTIPSPNPVHSNYVSLSSLATISANDVWAIGDYDTLNTSIVSLIEHWNGTTWNIVPSPPAVFDIYGVTVISSTDVWVSGSTDATFGYGPAFAHWDGTNWNIIDTSPPNYAYSVALSAVSATDIWSVGIWNNGDGLRTLVDHWDGTQWTVVPGPNFNGEPTAVSAISKNNVWVLGDTGKALFAHWDGTQWSEIPTPLNQLVLLFGLARIPGTTHLWAVGSYINTHSNQRETRTYYYC